VHKVTRVWQVLQVRLAQAGVTEPPARLATLGLLVLPARRVPPAPKARLAKMATVPPTKT